MKNAGMTRSIRQIMTFGIKIISEKNIEKNGRKK
jgi:hypothetical protein